MKEAKEVVCLSHTSAERERVDVDTTEVSIQVIQLYLEEDLKVLCIIQLERAATIFSYGGVFFREHFNAPAEGGVQSINFHLPLDLAPPPT